MIVANKFQTGFDQPLLAGMFLDKPVVDRNAVQTVSRLNRCHEGKQAVVVVDFTNNASAILKAFAKYRKGTPFVPDEPDPELCTKRTRCRIERLRSSWPTITLRAAWSHQHLMWRLPINSRPQVPSSGFRCWTTSSSTGVSTSVFWNRDACNLNEKQGTHPAPTRFPIKSGWSAALDRHNSRIRSSGTRLIRRDTPVCWTSWASSPPSSVPSRASLACSRGRTCWGPLQKDRFGFVSRSHADDSLSRTGFKGPNQEVGVRTAQYHTCPERMSDDHVCQPHGGRRHRPRHQGGGWGNRTSSVELSPAFGLRGRRRQPG
jgi:hypothetical protein